MGAGPAGSIGSNDTEVSAYEREITKQKKGTKKEINKGVNVTTYGETKTGVKPADYNPEKDDNYQENKLENYKIKDSDAPGLIGSILNLTKGARQKSFEVNRDYYQKNVVGKGNYKNTFEDYERYIKGRGAGTLDAMGRTINQKDDGGNNQPTQETIIKKNIGGSEVQTTQTKIDEQKAKSDEYDVRKVKKRGRKQYTLTSSKGVTQVSDDYSLGKKSLLGTV